jgi:hypothetical protein
MQPSDSDDSPQMAVVAGDNEELQELEVPDNLVELSADALHQKLNEGLAEYRVQT